MRLQEQQRLSMGKGTGKDNMSASDSLGAVSTASARSARPLTTSYADLMKPDEDWRNLPDAADRRKIQNRLAQRAYRRNMRDRTKEVEKLKKQLEDLQENLGQNRNPTPPSDHESPPESHFISRHSTPPTESSTPILPIWSQPESQQHLNSISLGGVDATFDPHLLGGDNDIGKFAIPSSYTGSRPTTNSDLENTVYNAQYTRDIGSESIMGSGCFSLVPGQWPSTSLPESRTLMAVGPLPSISNSMLGVAGHDTFGLSYSSTEDAMILQGRRSFSLDEGLALTSIASPPEASSLACWTGARPATIPTPSIAPSLSMAEMLPSMPPNVPETSAPLVHFAVASGSLDTLHVLLERYDVDVQARDQVGYTPLQRAVASGRTDMVQTLLDHGARADGGPLRCTHTLDPQP